jgi:hypothetical protein
MGASVIFPSFSISSVLWLLSQSSFNEYGISPCLFGSELSTSVVGKLFIRVIFFHSIKFLSFKKKKKKKKKKKVDITKSFSCHFK